MNYETDMLEEMSERREQKEEEEISYSAASLWNEILQKMIKEVAAISLDMWIRPLVPLKIENDKLYVLAPTENGKNMVTTKFGKLLNNILLRIKPELTEVAVVDETGVENTAKEVVTVAQNALENFSAFKEIYTFENFVVGRSNQLAYAVACAVAEEPGKRHNPMFLYGGVGLGKTHLLHAIGNQIKSERPQLKVLYVPVEKFMNELISSLGGKKQQSQEFRDKYRCADVLMVDDIQFIAGKERTQEEFFHTFEDLYNNNKQIIICSDRPAKDINPLEERLRSRFNWDMTVDIQPPDLETRIAILQKKAQIKRINVKNDVLTMIAEKVSTNTREMEGFFSRVVSFSQLLARQPSVELVKEVLKDYIDDNVENITIDSIIDTVCSYYKTEKDDLFGKKKNKEIVEPRMVSIYIITEMLSSVPLVKIGQVFGGRDHTTIIHARDKIAEQVKTNPRIKTVVKDIMQMLK